MTSGEWLTAVSSALEPFAPLTAVVLAWAVGIAAIRLIVGAIRSAVRGD